MNRDVMGIIYAGETNLNLRELVMLRSLAALPVGGRYRAIDFPLSNMVNSGIRKVGVITQRNYHSLMDHLGSGKDWNLNKRNNGLYLLPPYDTSENHGVYRGLCDAIHNNLYYIKRAKEEYCLLCGSYTIYNAVYGDMMDFHISNGADITVLYNREPDRGTKWEHFKDLFLETDESGAITDMKFNSYIPSSGKMGMDIYFLKKDLLIYLIEEVVARGRYGLITDVLMENFGKLKMYGYEYKGFVSRLVSVESYYKLNMDMLNADIYDALFNQENAIYTRIKDEVPAKYAGGSVKNSLVANGCIIEGDVENSIIFRGVHIGKNSVVKNSIIIQGSDISAGSRLENVILDKSVLIREGRRLIGDERFPVIIKKEAVV